MVDGHISSLLTLGVGFDSDLSGIDNIRLAGAFMGMRPPRGRGAAGGDRRVRGAGRVHRRADQDVLVGHARAARVRDRDLGGARTSCCSTRCSPRATPRSARSPSSGSLRARRRREGDRPRDPRHELGPGVLHPGDAASSRAGSSLMGSPEEVVRVHQDRWPSAAREAKERACSRRSAARARAEGGRRRRSSAAAERSEAPPARLALAACARRSRSRRPQADHRPGGKRARASRAAGAPRPRPAAAISTRRRRPREASPAARSRCGRSPARRRPRGRRCEPAKPWLTLHLARQRGAEAPELHADVLRARRADAAPLDEHLARVERADAAQADLDRRPRSACRPRPARCAGSRRRAGPSARRARGAGADPGAAGARRGGRRWPRPRPAPRARRRPRRPRTTGRQRAGAASRAPTRSWAPPPPWSCAGCASSGRPISGSSRMA